MYRQSTASFLYIAYATLTIGLLVTSFLSPIQHRTIRDRSLRVYGVLLEYDSPPPEANWTPDPTDSSSFPFPSSSSSLSSSSSSPSSSSSGNVSLNETGSSSSASSLSSDASAEPTTTTTSTSSTTDLPTESDRVDDDGVLSLRELHTQLINMWHESDSALKQTTLARDAVTTTSSGGAAVSSSSSMGSASADDNTVKHYKVSVRALTSIPLGKFMVAYLSFAAASLVFSIIIIFTATIQLVPDVAWIKLSVVSLALFVSSVVCTLLCTAMAASIAAQNNLYVPVAQGYYARTFEIGFQKGVSSGFSSVVAALVLSLLSLIVIFVFQRQ